MEECAVSVLLRQGFGEVSLKTQKGPRLVSRGAPPLHLEKVSHYLEGI